MRLRTALAGTGLAALMVGGLSVPAHAATWWSITPAYGSKKLCVDAGQQYEREGWPYRCLPYSGGAYLLQIWQ
jgi:hypothetical protein